MRRAGPWIAAALLVLTNLFVLAGVWRNRSGERDATLALTEREVPLERGSDDNSGVALRLQTGRGFYTWNYIASDDREEDWFGREKLEEIGFDCSVAPEDPRAERFYANVLPRRTYAVLEYEGKAWESWKARQRAHLEAMEQDVESGKIGRKQLESAREGFESDLRSMSRLFIVDAGNDPSVLRSRHPDRRSTAIVPAEARLSHFSGMGPDGKQQAWRLEGHIREILVSRIHVPVEVARVTRNLPRLQRGGVKMSDGLYDDEPAFEAAIAFGSRHEPWLEELRPLRDASITPLPGEKPRWERRD